MTTQEPPQLMPYLNDDILERIAEHLDPTLNVCLAGKIFYNAMKRRTPQRPQPLHAFLNMYKQTHVMTCVDTTPIDHSFLWNEIKRIPDRFMYKCEVREKIIYSAIYHRNMSFFEDGTLTPHDITDFRLLIIHYAANHRWIPLLNLLKNKNTDNTMEDFVSVTNAAARHGDIELLKWAIEENCPWHYYTMVQCIEGKVPANEMECMLQLSCPWNPLTTSVAALNGRYDVLDMVQRLDLEWDQDTLTGLLQGMEILKDTQTTDIRKQLVQMCITESGCKWDSNDRYLNFTALINIGDVDFLEWLFDECGHPLDVQEDTRHMKKALKKDKRDMLRVFFERGMMWSFDMGITLLSTNNLDLLKWCIAEHGYKWSDSSICFLAEGDFDIIKWAIANGCEWEENSLEYIAEFHSREDCEWAVLNGCPRNNAYDWVHP